MKKTAILKEYIRKVVRQELKEATDGEYPSVKSAVETAVKSVFPKSTVEIKSKNTRDGIEMVIDFAVGKKSEWPINSMGDAVYSERFAIDGFDSDYDYRITNNNAGSFPIKSATGAYSVQLKGLYYEHSSITKIVNALNVYMKYVKGELKKNKDKFLDRHEYAKKHL